LRGCGRILGPLTVAAMCVVGACGIMAARSLPAAAGPGAGVAFLDNSHGWALADCTAGASLVPGQAGCTLLATTDGGRTWTAVAKGLPASAHLQFVTAQVGFATIEGGTCPHGLCPGYVIATTDGGRTWAIRYSGPVEIASIAFSSATAGWSIVDGGVDTSTDGGVHWHQSVPFARGVMNACTMAFVRFSTGRAGIAGGSGAGGPCLATTADGGSTWKLAAIPGGQGCTVSGGAGSWLEVGCGTATTVWLSSDGGSTWQKAWSGGPQPLYFLNGTTAWRGAQRTTDGGATWTNGQSLGSAAVAFVSTSEGWARMADGTAIYATTNGGATWSKQWP
jgi:photosystem II stability/assembly factor-like uncharacterized protein